MADRREEILDAAVALADEHGLDAVSMRAVAQRVGVTPMALYPHIGGKSGLRDAMVGRLLAGLPPAGEPTGGARYLRDFAHATRKLVLGHPWAATLLFDRSAVTAEAVGAVDRIYQALLALGVPPAEIARLERLVSTFVIGFAVSETGGRFQAHNPRGRRDEASGQALPGHEAIAGTLETEVDWDAEFEADLDDLEAMIQAVVARAAGAPGTLDEPNDAYP
ncbi:TetR/AcrR family transcriptional regulator [Amycolatopsis acidicola]|uniref:TetR/AcrR family transcriptional regulator n=1 Tax=Amycolatopsis acidicola TaxID=2596893 RepID=A0A5N0V412_9PSEU|nr:TetR/AcrR family transcriptional regulator [Amycolatopsis acidicola]KAA9158586.1 TetR/AcrR family transcriptional regulator [Amycolatopsis acidicola]